MELYREREKNAMPEYRELLRRGRKMLSQADIADGNTDAWLLLEYQSGLTRTEYFLREREEAGDMLAAEYLELVEKRAKHVPLQHLIGEAWFYGRKFFVNESVLIPRQDTEVLVEEILCRVKGDTGLKILDMCTGSGCILLTLLSELEGAQGTGSDLSEAALLVARKNAENLEVEAEWIHSDLFSTIQGKYDIIVSNPPYIASSVIEGLMEEVRDYEPRMALDGREDGLYFYREIVRQAGDYLKPGGLLAFEIGHDQGTAVRDMLLQWGYGTAEVRKDLAGLDRVVLGCK